MGFNHSPLTPRTHARDEGFGDISVFFLSREFKERHTHSVTFRLHFTEANTIPGRILAGDQGKAHPTSHSFLPPGWWWNKGLCA